MKRSAQRLALGKISAEAIAMPINPGFEKKLILGLITLTLILGVVYGYFVKQTIVNVVERKEIEEEMADSGSRVSNLEVTYIELENKIDLDFAYFLGYKEAGNVRFISRNSLAKNITLKN
jgi:hypothetical protein